MLTAGEALDLHGHGVKIELFYEDWELQTAGGAPAGVHCASVAVFEALAVGCPPGAGVVIYMACDTPNPPLGTREFFTAAGPILQHEGFARGFYGNPDAGRMMLAGGLVDAVHAVETWGSRNLGGCAIVQRVRPPVFVGGTECDTDDLLGPAAGLWVPGATGWTTG